MSDLASQFDQCSARKPSPAIAADILNSQDSFYVNISLVDEQWKAIKVTMP